MKKREEWRCREKGLLTPWFTRRQEKGAQLIKLCVGRRGLFCLVTWCASNATTCVSNGDAGVSPSRYSDQIKDGLPRVGNQEGRWSFASRSGLVDTSILLASCCNLRPNGAWPFRGGVATHPSDSRSDGGMYPPAWGMASHPDKCQQIYHTNRGIEGMGELKNLSQMGRVSPDGELSPSAPIIEYRRAIGRK